MAAVIYKDMRENDSFSVHTLDICFSICDIELKCQARYVRVHQNEIGQDDTDKLIEATVKTSNSNVTHVVTLNQKGANEPFHNQLKYSYKIDVPVEINLMRDSKSVQVDTNIKFVLELYCEDKENINFFTHKLSNKVSLDIAKWGAYESNLAQYVPFSKFLAK